MRSRHVDRFNHDDDAATYDADVSDESHPIRAGYRELLEWVVDAAAFDPTTDVLELGAGTGNLTAKLLNSRHVTAVDTSPKMLELARIKCAATNLSWVQADLLEVFARTSTRYHRIVSTYTIHHLEHDEKLALFERVHDALHPGGVAVFGDLMFETAVERTGLLAAFRDRGLADVVEAIEAEYFWLLEDEVPALEALGFRVEQRRFSDLSWGLRCSLPATSAPSATSKAPR